MAECSLVKIDSRTPCDAGALVSIRGFKLSLRAFLGGSWDGVVAFVVAEGVAFFPGADTARGGGGDIFLDVDCNFAGSWGAGLAGLSVGSCISLAGAGEAFVRTLSSVVGSNFLLLGIGVLAGAASFDGASFVLFSLSREDLESLCENKQTRSEQS